MLGKYQSGQMGQTVNLLAYAFGGSNPSLPTENQIVIERNCLIFFFIYIRKPQYWIVFRSTCKPRCKPRKLT